MQITPDGDYSQTGVAWNKIGYGSPHHKQFVVALSVRAVFLAHKTESGIFFSFPWIVAPTARGIDRRTGLEQHLEGLQQFRRPEQLHPRPSASTDADG